MDGRLAQHTAAAKHMTRDEWSDLRTEMREQRAMMSAVRDQLAELRSDVRAVAQRVMH